MMVLFGRAGEPFVLEHCITGTIRVNIKFFKRFGWQFLTATQKGFLLFFFLSSYQSNTKGFVEICVLIIHFIFTHELKFANGRMLKVTEQFQRLNY